MKSSKEYVVSLNLQKRGMLGGITEPFFRFKLDTFHSGGLILWEKYCTLQQLNNRIKTWQSITDTQHKRQYSTSTLVAYCNKIDSLTVKVKGLEYCDIVSWQSDQLPWSQFLPVYCRKVRISDALLNLCPWSTGRVSSVNLEWGNHGRERWQCQSQGGRGHPW